MLTYKPASESDYIEFMQLIHVDAGDYLEHAMRLLQMDWKKFEHLFRTVGEVCGIYKEDRRAGFYWIEHRDDVLHIHGLLLTDEFQDQGIGSAVLGALEERFSGSVKRMELAVHDSNMRAKRLYERLGYRTVRRLEDEGFDIMQREIGRDAGQSK